MRPITQIRTLTAADPNGIFLDQAPTDGVPLTLNGAFVTAGVAQLDVQRQVELESAANLAGINFTIEGTDEQGRPISETIAGPNAGTVATSLDFFTVTEITPDGTSASLLEGGTNAVGGSIPIPVDKNLTPTSIGLGLILTTVPAVNVTVQHTFDDIFTDDPSTIHTWFDHPTLNAVTTNDDGNLAFPPTAVRLLTNSGTGTARFELIQSGAVA
jgi:hypothetical protein